MMKMKWKNVAVGALATLSVGAVSAGASALGGVEASAAYTAASFNTDSMTGIDTTSIANGTVTPNVGANVKFKAMTTEYGGNSNAQITTDFTCGAGQWGVMIYYLKWNEGVDNVTWDWTEGPDGDPAGPTPDYQFNSDSNVSKGLMATNVSGDWLALVVGTTAWPSILECKDGVIQEKQDCTIWIGGDTAWNDLNANYFNQQTIVKLGVTDLATGGVQVTATYEAVGVGTYGEVPLNTGTFTSTNPKLQGEGAFGIERVKGSADFSTNTGTIEFLVEENESSVTPEEPSEPLDENDWAGDSTKWATLSNVSVNSSKGLVPSAAANNTMTATTTSISSPTTTAQITTDFKCGDGKWGIMIYYFKWNEGTDSVEWDWGSDYKYPLEFDASNNPVNGLKAISSSGDWIAVVVSNMSAPLVIECKGGVMQEYQDIRIWENGFGIADYGQLFNQKTVMNFAIADTETGISMTATFDAVGLGLDEIGLNIGTYESTNTALKGEGAISIQRVKGEGAFTGTSKINAIIMTTEATALGTPELSLTDHVASWDEVENASGYIYKIGEDGEEQTTTNTFVELTNGNTLYVKAKGDGIYYKDGEWSAPVTFTAKELPTPSVTISGYLASWDSINSAKGYKYKIDDGEAVTTNATSVELLHGQTITVMAVGDDLTGFDSGWSEAKTFTAPALDNLVLTSDTNTATVTWLVVTGAMKYAYTIDGGAEMETTNTYVSVKHNQMVKVRAVGDLKNYSYSEWAEITYTAEKLQTPVLEWSKNTVSWPLQSGATGYICKVDGVEQSVITINSISLKDGQTLQVKAVGDNAKTVDSDWSALVTYEATVLDSPYIEINDNVVSWEKVDGATGYICEINGVEQEMIITTSTLVKDGDVVRVKACGNGETSKDSDWSNEETCVLPALSTPKVTLNGNEVSWDPVSGATAYVYKMNDGEERELDKSVTSFTLTNGQKFQVKAVGNGTTNKDSEWSEAKTYTATQLAAPTVSISGNMASWGAVTGAVGYKYKIDNGQEVEIGANEEREVKLTDGQSISVLAVGDGVTSLTSEWSEAKTYTAAALETPVVTLYDEEARWSPVVGATAYVYTINGGQEQTTTATSVDLTDGQTIVVKAIDETAEFKDSEWSEAKTYTAAVLETPVLTIEGNVVSWGTVTGAVGYAYKLGENGEEKSLSLTQTSVTLTDGQSIVVKACGNGTTSRDSAWSEGKTYTASALDAPVLTLTQNGVRWEAVVGATAYAYKINGGEEKTTSALSVGLTDGQSIVVKACGNGETSKDSAWSEAKTYTAAVLKTPVLTIEGNVVSWEAVDGANGYKYKINDGEEKSLTAGETSLVLIDGQTVVVKACGNSETSKDSAWSEGKTYTASALNAPVVVLNGGIATWEAVDGANGYKYKIDGGEERTTSELSVGLTDGQTIVVKACGNGETSKDSAWSESKTYTAPTTPDEPDQPVIPDEPDIPVVPETTAAEVQEMIAALKGIEGTEIYEKKTSYTRAHSKYLAAKEAYYNLSEEDQASVTNSDKLTTIKAELDAFRAAVDKAEAVDDMIVAIPSSGITSANYEVRKAQIEKAREAYEALTEEQKAYCAKLNYLENREEALKNANEAEEGCGSSVGGFAVVGLALAALAAVRTGKKRED